MRLTRSLTVAAVALLAAAGCAEQPQTGPKLASYQVAGETVYVDEAHASSVLYPSLDAFAAEVPVIVTGTVALVNPRAAEYKPGPDVEGEHPSDGPDIYGTITFTVTEVLKGGPVGPQLTVVYQSGKRDGRNPRQRIAYQHDALAPFQLDNGELRAPADLAGATFVVFASPNRRSPVYRDAFVLAHPLGMARRTGADGLTFVTGDRTPLGPVGAAPTVTDLRRAAK